MIAQKLNAKEQGKTGTRSEAIGKQDKKEIDNQTNTQTYIENQTNNKQTESQMNVKEKRKKVCQITQ